MQNPWLSSEEVLEKQRIYWPNMLPEKKPPTDLEIILNQLKSPLVYILLIAGVITFFLGEFEDTVIIMFSVVLNTVLWWYQESKAGKALQALKNMLQITIQVIRDGILQTIPTQDLVPGDIVLCKAWSKIPADGFVLESNKLLVSEAMLTGESLPIEKKWDDLVYMWTVGLSGNAYLRVEKIWVETDLGKIALSLQWAVTITPLQKQLHHFSKQLTWLVVFIVFFVFIIGIIRHQGRLDIFTTAVALAVWAIPEWLLVALTMVLTIGMQRILKKKWLVKNLVSAETLWWVTVICSDKTWTLTHGTMEVSSFVGDELQLYTNIIRNTWDDNAVAQALKKRTVSCGEKYKTSISQGGEQLDVLPFSSDHKYTACLWQESSNEKYIYVTWAPEYLLSRSNLSQEEQTKIKKQIETYTESGYRLVACAWKVSHQEKLHHEEIASGGLSWIWIICLNDPIREDVKEALQKTHQAGIKLIVITWDYAWTACAIMKKLWVAVDTDMVMTWDRLAQMSDMELDMRLEQDSRIKLFARTKPEQKMRIVQALKDDGEIVAMMWDGVNDAPALKLADIGIVVSEATEVAKESADLILLDSSFSTIVSAVEEGRSMFDNIRKIVLYLLCDAFEEIIVIVFCIITWTVLPVTAAQILWINLVSDWFPNIALTIDPKRKWLMNLPPRSPKEYIVNAWIKRLIVIVSITWAALCFLIFSWVLHLTNDLVLARSVAFVTLGINSLVYVFSVKTLDKPCWHENVFNNGRLLIAVWWWILLQMIPFLFSTVGDFLDIVRIWNRFRACIGASLVMFMIIELNKQVTKK